MKAVLHFSLFSSFLTVCNRFTNCETRVIGKPTFLAFLLSTKRAQYVKTRSLFMSYALTFLLCNARLYLKPLRNGGVDSRTNKTFTHRENLASGKLNRNFTFAPSLRSLQIISAWSSTVTIKMNGRGFSNPDSSYSVTMSSGECARLLSKNEKVRFEPKINLLCTFNNLRALSFLLKGLDSRNSNEISNKLRSKNRKYM